MSEPAVVSKREKRSKHQSGSSKRKRKRGPRLHHLDELFQDEEERQNRTSVARNGNEPSLAVDENRPVLADKKAAVEANGHHHAGPATTDNAEESISSIPPNTSRRRRVEFVYPREYKPSPGGRTSEEVLVVKYEFAKQRTAEKRREPLKEAQTSESSKKIRFDDDHVKNKKKAETIEDILFSGKKALQVPKTSSKYEETDSHSREESDKKNKQTERLEDRNKSEGSHNTHSQMKEAPKKGTPQVDGLRRQLSGVSVEDAVRDKAGCRPRSNSTDGELNLPRRGLCDEHTVLESHKWNDEIFRLNRGAPPRGFVNLGNSCFLNATLQCLAFLPTFCQCIATLPAKGPVNEKGKNKLSHGQRITLMLRTLLRQVHNADISTGGDHARNPIAPRAIVQAITTLGSSKGRGYKFRPGRQEDAHEFLVHLLDSMKDGELKAAGIDQRVSGWRDLLPIPRLDETTFIHRIFGGYLRSQVRCTKCGYRSNTYDPFMDLSLEVSKKTSNSVASAFSEFTRKETLDAANQWKCSGCKKYVCATKQLTVFRPPLSLCIQLKRFAFGGRFGHGFGFPKGGFFGHFGSSGGGSKISKPIEFPADLRLPLSDGRKCEYALTGVVIHVGGSASSGHYTAYVKKPGRNGGHRWYHMDDSFVEPVSEKRVLMHKDVYVLFYCRKEVKLEFPPLPPRASMSAPEALEHSRARAMAKEENRKTRVEHATKEKSNGTSADETTASPTAPNYRTIQSLEPNGSKRAAEPGNQVTNVHKAQSAVPLSKNVQQISDASSPSVSSSSGSSRRDSGSVAKSSTQSQSSTGVGSPRDNGNKEGFDMQSVVRPPSTTEASSQSRPSDSSNDSSSSSNSDSETAEEPGVSALSASGPPGPENDHVHKRSEAGPSESNAPLSGSNLPDRPTKTRARPDRTATRAKNKEKVSVVLDRGGQRGKVEVKLGRRQGKKVWKPKASIGRKEGSELLGNVHVDKWDQVEEDSLGGSASLGDPPKTNLQAVHRQSAMEELEKRERSRKKKRHLDNWNAKLDEGRRKKVKTKDPQDSLRQTSHPKENVFHRIQSSMQKMRAPHGFTQKGSKSNLGKKKPSGKRDRRK